jgi:hypothetical protein
MTSTQQPSHPQPASDADPGITLPQQRQHLPVPPAAAPPPARPRRRWTWAVGGVALGLVIGLAANGGTAAPATRSAAMPPTAAAPQTVYVTVPAAAPATTAPAAAETPAPTAPAGPLTSFSDGTYEVGTDVAPGKYKTPGPASSDILDSCYMEVGDGSGRIGAIDQNDNLTGPGVVTLKAGKVFKVRGDCTWTKVG